VFGSVVALVDDAAGWPAYCRRLRDAGLYPEPLARGTTADAHRAAWQRAAVRDEPTLVIAGHAALVDPWPPALAAASEALEGVAWHVVHLDAERAGAAYIVSPVGASLLLDAPPAAGPVSEVMEQVGALEVLGLDPPVVGPSGEPDGQGPPGVEAGEIDDLVRLLRYQDAIGLGDSLGVVGDELVSVPFWTLEFCATVIRAAEALDAWDSDELDPVPGQEVSLAVLCPRLFAHVEDHLAASIVPQLRAHWPTLEFHGLRDAFVIRYTASEATGLRLHHDVAQVSGSVRLNDGYEGGELVFPRQGVGNAGLPVGRLLAWPSLVTHPHASEPVRRGVKYSLTIWFEVPGSQAS
jgi:hypothetical protein